MPCEVTHHVDHDPCMNCGSTRTEPLGDEGTLDRCLDCGTVFDVDSPEYLLYQEGVS